MPNLKSRAKYDAKTAYYVSLKLNKKTDADLVELLESIDNKQGFIKDALRAYQGKEKDQ